MIKACQPILRRYASKVIFTCPSHTEWGFVFATKIVINIFFNNKQKTVTADVRKKAVDGLKNDKERNKSIFISNIHSSYIHSVHYLRFI